MLYGRKDRQNNRRYNMGVSEALHKTQIRKELSETMDLLDRILGLKSEQQEQVDKLIAIIEENEELKKDKEKLEKQVAELEEEILLLSEGLDAEREKIRHIEEVIENSMATIREMK